MLGDVREWLQYEAGVNRVAVADDFGQTETETEVATIDCYIRSTAGGETQQYGKTDERSTHALYCEDTVDIREDDIVVWDGERYNVRYVDRKDILGDGWLQVELEYVGVEQ